MKRRKASVSEEEFNIRDKVSKASKRASETRKQTLHRQEQNGTHMISINTYHLACTEGSALQCCSFELHCLSSVISSTSLSTSSSSRHSLSSSDPAIFLRNDLHTYPAVYLKALASS